MKTVLITSSPRSRLALTALIVLAGLCCPLKAAAGGSEDIMKELKALKKRIEHLENKLAQQDKQLKKHETEIDRQESAYEEIRTIKSAIGNLELSVGATSVVQGTINNDGNSRRIPWMADDGDDTDAQYSVDIEISAPVGDNGRALVYLESGEGAGLNQEAAGLTGVNYDAMDDDGEVNLAEIWYEHRFFNDTLITTFGKLDLSRWVDTNAVAGDECTQFLADIFRWNIAIDWPDDDYGYGTRITYHPVDLLSLTIGLVESDSDFEDIFDNNLMIAEAGLYTDILGRPGNYRFYVWRNSGDHEKLKEPWRGDKKSHGFGVSFDQEISDYVAAFLRYGQQTHDVFAVSKTWSLGFQVDGTLWDRPEDMLGIAYGQAHTSGSYRDVLREDRLAPAGAEKRFEAYYRCQLNDHLALSPDIQVVQDLESIDSAHTITVLGVRAQLDF